MASRHGDMAAGDIGALAAGGATFIVRPFL